MKAYHEIHPESLDSALAEGLKRTSRGSKGDNEAIIKTDRLLDSLRPQQLTAQGISRDDNLYSYVGIDDFVIDIVDGTHVPIDDFVDRAKLRVLELDIDPARSFVSNLDAYDALKDAIETRANRASLERLANDYWSSITKLTDFLPHTISRPEIMVPYDVPPNKIRLLN